ncbi:fibronectin type III domain-containing protein [bacterium]|nr:fibronectin type III domain-containing protein [bacterium]
MLRRELHVIFGICARQRLGFNLSVIRIRALRVLLPVVVVVLVILGATTVFPVGSSSSNAPPRPPIGIALQDRPNDAGGAIEITWEASKDDSRGRGTVNSYSIYRSEQPQSGFVKIKTVSSGKEEYRYNDEEVENDKRYYYRVTAETSSDAFSDSGVVGPVTASPQWFHSDRWNMLIALLIVSASVLTFITLARKGKDLYIRPIAGLQAVDEAVGRATEMGRPVLYVPGILDMDDVQTIAGVAILGRVARKTAEYETSLLVPVSRSVVMSAAQETVKEAYWDMGKADAYHPDMVRYITDDQFGFAAGVDGIMLREKPATVFFQGAFYAESLILAETGHSIGAVQIAGTAMTSQLPFFVTACDYTLIGEELFAAGAYLTEDPRLVGSLKGQDVAKGLAIAFIVIGIILETAGYHWLTNFLKVN